MHDELAARVLTPDQRLRVFISSTLQELGPERAAARAAIESLQLTPVWFGHGARPHPPETLYRAYLEQSQIFIGIYWQSYGWIAAGAEFSGIEVRGLMGRRRRQLRCLGGRRRRERRLQPPQRPHPRRCHG
jgi:uncharacterized protein DUF4062